jgi:hypothetical protein
MTKGIVKKELERVVYRIGAEAGNQAQEKAPYRTGNLRNDIQVFDGGRSISWRCG